MKIFPTLLSITIVIGAVQCFINPYPKSKPYHDKGDPGEALYLTEYIERGEYDLAKNLSFVNYSGLKWLPSYAAYLTINKEYKANTFFWFFPAKYNSAKAPVVLWLQGGPGASSIFGLVYENGPFYITSDNKVLPREYSWHLNNNLLYIDNPVGSGFSFTVDDKGYATNEVDVGNALYSAIQQFFTLFSELRGNAFYIVGESYAGKYVPALGHTILSNRDSGDPKINLQGLGIGNGLSDPVNQLDYGDYLYQIGLIDANTVKIFNEYEKQATDCIKNKEFEKANDLINELIAGGNSVFQNYTGYSWYYNYLDSNGSVPKNAETLMGDFVQSSETRKAIHVGNNTFYNSDGASKVADYLKNDMMDSVSKWVEELLGHYKILFYNGQLDILCAYPMAVNYLKTLKFNGSEEYKVAPRSMWKVGSDIAGYVKHAGNLTELLVRSAGHMVPAEQPKWALDMLTRMTNGNVFV